MSAMVADAEVGGLSSNSPKTVASGVDPKRAEDARLVERVLEGDIEAFESLYRRHAPTLFGLALRMLHNRSDAEDLVQEIFLQAYHKLSRFEGRSAFGTWLYRLGTNRCLDHLRSRSNKEQSRTDPISPALSAARLPGGTRGLELERAVAELPPSSRAAFLLHDAFGYEHKEVSQMLGIATGTSKSLVHRARMKLRDRLNPASGRIERTPDRPGSRS